MDPNNNQPQGDDSALKKIEEDLQKLSSEAAGKMPANDLPPAPSVPETPMASVGLETKTDSPAFPMQHDTPPAPPVDKTVDTAPTVTATPSATPPANDKKGSPLLMISIILVVIALLAAVAYVVGATYVKNASKAPVACTADAKLCPDGSSVGRSGPNCEFDACPAPVATPEITPVNQGTPSASPNATTSGNLNVRTGLSPASSPAASPSSTPITY